VIAALAGAGTCLLVILTAGLLCRAVGDRAAMAVITDRPGEDAQWDALVDGMRRYHKHRARLRGTR
jgi:hypothetical protein